LREPPRVWGYRHHAGDSGAAYSGGSESAGDCIDRLCGEAVMRVNEEDAGTLCSLRQREVNEFERIFTVSSYERMLFLLELISLREEAGEGRR